MSDHESLALQKKALRRQALRARHDLGAEARQALGRRIAERLFAYPPFAEARAIHIFCSFGTEVPTLPILERLWREGRRVVMPLTDLAAHTLRNKLVRALDELRPGAMNILEPAPDAEEVAPDGLDLIVVPGVAFDARGGRLGYGGGFYDRLLAQSPAHRAALAFAAQIIPAVPVGAHDLPVQAVVTENGVLRCEGGE